MDQYILSLSYGKDSLACLGAIDKLGLPLDRIIHAEVWATDTIPADLPPMVEFKKKADAIIKYRWGIEVEHVYATCRGGCGLMNAPSMNSTNAENTLGSSEDSPCSAARGVGTDLKETSLTDVQKLTYEKIFYRVRSLNGGGQRDIRIPDGQGSVVQQLSQTECPAEITGFATRWSQYCTGELKRTAITGSRFQYIGETGVLSSKPEFSNSARSQGAATNIVQYLGIAADEPERIARHTKPGIILPLVEAGWDEAFCRQWCSDYSLLSPIYTASSRGGCWFCHNQTINQLRLLRKNYPELWTLLMKWDSDSPVTFKADGHTVHDFDKRFRLEDEGKIPSDRKFRWKMMEGNRL